MNFVAIHPFITLFIHGIFITLSLMVLALACGFLLAIFLCLCCKSHFFYLRWIANSYVFVIRGSPLLIQFFLIYYGLSQFAALRESILWILLQKPFACAVIALAINTSAYTTVLLCGAIDAISRGEIEACQALGMSWLLMMRKIILPRAFRIMLPAYSNEVLMILKGSSLASTITLLDIMGVTQRIISQTYAAIEFLLLAGVIYFLLNIFLMTIFRRAEIKLNQYRL